MTSAADQSSRDLVLVFDYLDDQMAPEQREQFERRLLAEPELAAEVAGLAGVDLIGQLPARQVGTPVVGETESDSPPCEPSGRPSGVDRSISGGQHPRKWSFTSGPWRSGVAAAALLVATVTVALLWGDNERIRVAVLSRGDDRVGYQMLLGLDRALSPDGMGAVPRGGRGGAGRLLVVDPEEYAARVAAVEQGRRDEALEDHASVVEAGHFEIVVELTHQSEVVIAALDAKGRAWIMTPAASGSGGPPVLGPGRHVLPRRTIDPQEPAEGFYSPGYLVPRGAERLTILIAVRPPGSGGGGSDSLKVAIPEIGEGRESAHDVLAALTAALEEQHFEWRLCEVLEPED